MKNLWIKGLSGFALAFVAQASLAVPVVITSTATTGPKIVAPSQAVITPSPTFVQMLNVIKTSGRLPNITATDGASASIGYSFNAVINVTKIIALSFSSPVTTMTYESTTQAILGEALQGGLKFAVEQNPSQVYARGGEVLLKDLRVDHGTKTVYATVVGTNGVGTRQNVPFWTYTEATGDTTFPGGKVETSLKPVRFTADGLNAWAQSLGLTQDGLTVLNIINNSTTGFGNIAITVNTTVPPPEDPACKAQ